MQPSDEFDVKSRALIAFGANLPSDGRPPEVAVAAAMAVLSDAVGGTLAESRLFRTPAYPPGTGPDFVNAAVAVSWTGPAETLLEVLHRVEGAFGRTRHIRWEARLMDLDLIALGQTVLPDAETQQSWVDLPPERAAVETPDTLILPHPRLAERSFVLVPLADIAPDWRHPLTGLSIAQMLAARPAAERAEIRPIRDIPGAADPV